MVEASEDPAIVSAQRSYDVEKSRECVTLGITRPAGSDAEGRLDAEDGPAQAQEAVDAPAAQPAAQAAPSAGIAVPPAPPPDAAASYRRARLGVCACLVLALALLWILQRRGRQHG